MGGILISLLWGLIARILGSKEVRDATLDLVTTAMDMNVSGETKREAVLDGLRTLGGEVGAVVTGVSNAKLNLAIEAAVVYAKHKAGEE